MRIFALLALCFAAVAAAPKNPQRIVGGTTTTINRYPSIVALLFSWTLSNYNQHCGGTLLNSRTVLTAAHCPHGDTAQQWRVRVGSTRSDRGGRVHNVASFTLHPSYNPRVSVDHDIAVMRLSSSVSFNNNARAVQLAGANYNLPDNSVVWAAGWGLTQENGIFPSETLRHVQVWTVNQAICRQNYAPRVITDNMMCSGHLNVGGRDQCQGDSGGPLYHNGVQVGVCSWGIGCGRPQYPGVNIRVSRYISWIQQNS